jgi:hypothetical protein
MAKKITPEGEQTIQEEKTETTVIPIPENTNQEAGHPENTIQENETVLKPETNQPVETKPAAVKPVEVKPVEVKPETVVRNAPPFVEVILKSFPDYDSLYIDSHGGCYTKNTAPKIRGNAVLYKNPYYKS